MADIVTFSQMQAQSTSIKNYADSKYVPRTNPTAFSIATDTWVLNSSETSEFVYYADITSDLTANDYAEINFSRASQSIVAEANICASAETLSGRIRLYAENVPTSTISGEYIIMKGVV